MNPNTLHSLDEFGCFYLDHFYLQRRETIKVKLCFIHTMAVAILCIIAQHFLYTNTMMTEQVFAQYLIGTIGLYCILLFMYLFYRKRLLTQIEIEHKEQKIIFLQILKGINQENMETLQQQEEGSIHKELSGK